MRKVVYHPGTGTYWDHSDEWYTVQIPDFVELGNEEDYLFLVDFHKTNHTPYKCPECGKPSLELLEDE